jgi:hypothetical protein
MAHSSIRPPVTLVTMTSRSRQDMIRHRALP